jgi:hypothetical protein
MSITKIEIRDLLLSGVTPNELFHGVEILEPGIVGSTQKIRVKTPLEKRTVLGERTRQMIQANRDIHESLTPRNILQEIGGGPLSEGEWVQISSLPDHRELTVTGTRGVFRLKR